MFRISLMIVLAALLSFPALASGRGDLRSGYAALLRHDYERAIQYLTSAIETGDLSRANLVGARNISRPTVMTKRFSISTGRLR